MRRFSDTAAREGNPPRDPADPNSNDDRPVAALIGIVEWFQPGDEQHVDDVLADLRAWEVTELRTCIARTDYEATGGPEWCDCLMSHLNGQVQVLPVLALGSTTYLGPSNNGMPHGDPGEYVTFVQKVIQRYEGAFDYVELCGGFNGAGGWTCEPEMQAVAIAEMLLQAANAAREHGRRVVLGGVAPQKLDSLRFLARCGVLEAVDVVGIRAFPGLAGSDWPGWRTAIDRIRTVLSEAGSRAGVWITETGYPTAGHSLARQMDAFLAALEAPVDRVYWCTARDSHHAPQLNDAASVDEQDRHFGLKTATGQHKMLSRIWAEHGLEGLYRLQRQSRRLPQPSTRRYTLITGGAGFIGSNLAHRLLSAGRNVMVLDNLSRPGVERNLEWLHAIHTDRLIVELADIRNSAAVHRAVQKAEQIFDFSAQVAVTTSLTDPVQDFEVNARGTLNLLEAIRAAQRPIPLVYTSTNKVYGGLHDVRLRAFGDRYEPVSRCLRLQGIGEQRSLDFHSPYGCSKGTADQYVLDYARTMGLSAVVFRMSCIYGPRQFGTEDQGWVAHFLIRAMQALPITVYGDGRQVRDLLFVEDLLDAFELAQTHMSRISGQAFNIGGGPARTVSLLELLRLIGELTGQLPLTRHEDWRPADQKYYVSNTLKYQRATGWCPRVGVEEGVRRLYEWLSRAHLPVPAARPAECAVRQ
ncbi:MAG TPA: GDP-mannose 4,6-dehydratase [Phycisphaerae bacterium]|nr:GDP-mannose 4,6-dehydratase [Phycisphaerae bacterium]HOM50978.1 GDP-mannose 4,6-dehydratase [Phycisphaerae bacterium]